MRRRPSCTPPSLWLFIIVADPYPRLSPRPGAYLLLRLGHKADLDEVTQRLTADYEKLSDGHVLRAEYLASVGRAADAEAGIGRALDARLSDLRRGHRAAA